MTTRFEQMTELYLHYLQSRSPQRHARATQVLSRFRQDTKVETLDESNGHLVFHWITSQNWSPNTMRNALSVFNGLIRYADRGRYSLRGRLPRPEHKEPSLITAEQHTTLVTAALPELANVLKTLWATGARQGEIASTQVDQIRTTEHGMMIVLDQQKFKGQSRVIYVPPKTADLIRSLADAHDEGPIFRNASGNAWTTDALRSAFLRLCRKSNVNGVTLDSYRNSAGERLGRAGVDRRTIGRLLGHSPYSRESFLRSNDWRIFEAAKLLEEEK